MNPLSKILTITTSIGAATVGGVLFAFSAFVMPALARVPKVQGLAAMQAINIAAVRPPLMILLFGTAGGSAAVIVVAAVRRDGLTSMLAAGGAALYLLGVIGVTAVFHVPHNDALATLDPDDPSSLIAWTRYLSDWTAGNHVRAAAGIVAGAAIAASAVVGRR